MVAVVDHALARAGYRVLAFDHEFEGSNQADLQFRGPWVALGFVF